MTLDREAARALFGEAPAATPVEGAPYAAQTQASPFAGGSAAGRVNGRRDRQAIDWRLVAPVGVAVACIAAIAMFAIPRGDQAVEGKTVAATEVVAPPLAPAPKPMEAAAVVTPEPVVQRAVRRAPARTVAAAPNAVDSGVNVSATESAAPPAPTLGAPAAVDLTPVAPPPILQPAPAPEPQL